MKRMIPIGLTPILCALAFLAARPAGAADRMAVLATTFPIYQITRNVAAGRGAVAVSLMLPSQLGCPHDYAMTPQDMQTLSGADALVINGLNMEDFLDAALKNAGQHLKIIDSSESIQETLHYDDAEHEADHPASPPDKAAHGEEKAEAHEHEHAHHHHAGVNPHLFASPRMAALLAMNIAGGLSRIDPAGAALYAANAKAYAEKLNGLADDFAALGKRLRNNRIVTQHGVFDYLARDMGLSITAVVQPHAGQEPSAAEMLKLVKIIQEKKVGAVFLEPQYPRRIGDAIARDGGIPSAVLDPVATGPADAPLDHYEKVMAENLKTLEAALGVR